MPFDKLEKDSERNSTYHPNHRERERVEFEHRTFMDTQLSLPQIEWRENDNHTDDF